MPNKHKRLSQHELVQLGSSALTYVKDVTEMTRSPCSLWYYPPPFLGRTANSQTANKSQLGLEHNLWKLYAFKREKRFEKTINIIRVKIDRNIYLGCFYHKELY
jgi:hypothetical protein